MSSSTSQTPVNSRSSRPASIAPSISSILSDTTTITAPIHEQRGFKSREAYLAALNEFAESKMYMAAGEHTLQGWYGTKTMDDYKARPGLREGKKRRVKQAGGNDDVQEGRRSTMATLPEASEEGAGLATISHTESAASDAPVVDGTEKRGRFRRLSRVFSNGLSNGSSSSSSSARRTTIS